ncbi:MAG: MobF family relaxase [Verrucomicrobiota bacterium]
MVATLSRLTRGHAHYYTGGTNIIDEPEHEQAQPMTRFAGSGAQYLGIDEDRVTADDPRVKKLFEGMSPDGEYQLRRMQDRQRTNHKTGEKETLKARPAYDHVLNAPKSFSLAYAFGTDEQRAELLICHQRATQDVMDYLSERATTRTGAAGKNQEPVQPVFLIADHDTNRANEPHLHAHLVQFNFGLRENGKWGALDATHNFHDHHRIGGIYLGSLERELHDRNVQTREVELRHGKSFELVAVDKELVDEFSTRSKQSKAHLKEQQIEPTGKAMHIAVLDTREVKRPPVDKGQLQTEWQQRADKAGGYSPGDLEMQITPSREQAPPKGQRGHLVDLKPVRYSVETATQADMNRAATQMKLEAMKNAAKERAKAVLDQAVAARQKVHELRQSLHSKQLQRFRAVMRASNPEVKRELVKDSIGRKSLEDRRADRIAKEAIADRVQGKEKPRETMAGEVSRGERAVRTTEVGNVVADEFLKVKYGNPKAQYRRVDRSLLGSSEKQKAVVKMKGSEVLRAVDKKSADSQEVREKKGYTQVKGVAQGR